MKGLLVMSIKLLPCDYADSEMIIAWLNSESKKGNQLTSINPLFAKFKHEEKRYYYTQVNSVTDQYEFAQNGACTKEEIIAKMKERGFIYCGKCGSYLYFGCESLKLIEYFDTKEKHESALINAYRTQLLLLLINIFVTARMIPLWYQQAPSFIIRMIGMVFILFVPVYAFLDFIEIRNKRRNLENYIPVYKREIEIPSPIFETAKKILFLFIIVYILFNTFI